MKSLLFLLALVTSLSVTAQDVGDDDFDKVVAAYINLQQLSVILLFSSKLPNNCEDTIRVISKHFIW